ncbi:hypothetical protein [Clostridium sp.]|jgi:hypothetical protein|uniref:hypothetical protein n=1 Tax=Clostridium sp. TaxID=1506 RepID=UPI003EE9F350
MVTGSKQRGILLTLTLLVLIALYSLGILNYLLVHSKEPEGLMNSSRFVTIILALIQTIGLILVFKWKKLGLYLYTAACLTFIVIGFITSSSFILGAILIMLVYLIILGILYYLICPIWNYME